MICFSLSTERIKSIMLILYLLLAWPFVISLLLLIWCNVMKWLEAALGACLAGATGVGATSSSSLKPIRLSEHGERRTRGTGATRVSSHRQRGWGIGVRVEVGGGGGGPPSEMEASSQSRSPPQKTLFFFFFPKCMCNYTPNCPVPPSNERSCKHLIPSGRTPWGGLCNDRAPGPEGPLEETSIQLWPPTSIKDRLIICFGEKGLFIRRKLIVLTCHCSPSKTALQSTKEAELELK